MIERFNEEIRTGADCKVGSRFFVSALPLFVLASILLTQLGCSLTYTRPTQEMNDTAAAIRAAREVQSESLAPELYRQAGEWWFRAKREYKFKNFKLAVQFSKKARQFAEKAEFEALLNNGKRKAEYDAPDPLGASTVGVSSANDPYKGSDAPVLGPNAPPPQPPANMTVNAGGSPSTTTSAFPGAAGYGGYPGMGGAAGTVGTPGVTPAAPVTVTPPISTPTTP